MKKSLLLGLLFVFPISVFLFLKIFGKNEFDVAPLFQSESSQVTSSCGKISYPYSVPDSAMARLGGTPKEKFKVVCFKPGKDAAEFITQTGRFRKEFSRDSVGFFFVSDNNAVEPLKSGHNVVLDSAYLPVFRMCNMLLDGHMDALVVDREGRIRGQYDLDNLDDADRLIVELDILLKKY